MKKIFIPIVKIITAFGGFLRTIWRGKRFSTQGLIKADDISNAITLNRKKNTITGATAISIILSALGVYYSVTPTDLDRLKDSIEKSFERIEQLDYLTSSLDSAEYSSPNEYSCSVMRGKCKAVIGALNSNNKMLFEMMDWLDDNNYDSVSMVFSSVLNSYMSSYRYSSKFHNELKEYITGRQSQGFTLAINDLLDSITQGVTPDTAKFLKNKRYNSITPIDTIFYARFQILSMKYDKCSKAYVNYLIRLNEQTINSNKGTPNQQRKKKKKLLKEFVTSKERIECDLTLYELSNAFYEYLIAIQMNDKYSDINNY